MFLGMYEYSYEYEIEITINISVRLHRDYIQLRYCTRTSNEYRMIEVTSSVRSTYIQGRGFLMCRRLYIGGSRYCSVMYPTVPVLYLMW